MRKHNKISKTSSLFPIVGLVFLLLFSPCKVRNFIQAELNVPLTEVSSKSQTTTSNLSCYSSKIVDESLIQVSSSVKVLQLFFVRTFNFSVQFIENIPNETVSNYKKKRFLTPSVPLYILFKNFKVYL